MILGRHLSPPATAESGRGTLELERSAYTLLTRLDVQGPMSIGQLSDAFGLDASTLNRQTAKMVKAGVVRRIADPDGGVARKFEVTDEGRRQLDADRALKLTALTKILDDWSPEDVAELGTWMRRFNTAIEEYDGRPWPRD